MQPIRASIIIPVYNGARYLRECIDSALTQTEKNVEIIVINDGSTDETLSILETYTDARIHVLNHIHNTGVASARNTGLAQAHGKWCIFLDADDYMHPLRVQELCTYGEQMSADFVIDNHEIIYTNNVSHKTLFSMLGIKKVQEKIDGAYHVLYTPAIHPVIRRSFIVENKLSFKTYFRIVDDLYFWLECYGCDAKVYTYAKSLYSYRMHASSITKNKTALTQEMLDLFKDACTNSLLHTNQPLLHAIQNKYVELKEINTLRQVWHTGTFQDKISNFPRALYWITIKYKRLFLN